MNRKAGSLLSLFLAANLTAGTVFGSYAAVPPSNHAEEPDRVGQVKNSSYEAEIKTKEGGELSLSKNSNPSEPWNTITEDLVPGKTMFWDGGTTFSKADISTEKTLGAGTDSYGVQGVQMGTDVTGVKSYFLFEDEILCAGAGVESAESGQSVIQVVDNIPVDKNTNLSLTNPANGYRNVLTAAKDQWAPLVDTSTQETHTQRNWLSASSLPSSTKQLEWSYVFGDGSDGSYLKSQNVYCRLNTKGTGTVALAEFWTKPEETWQYTLVPGKLTTDYSNSALYQTEAKILVNTEEIQAAEEADTGVLAVNKWTDGESTLDSKVAGLTLKQSASMTLKKDASTGKMTVTVAKPSDSTEPYLELTIQSKGTEILSNSNQEALVESQMGENVYLKFDTSKMGEEPVVLEIQGEQLDNLEGEKLTMVRGESGKIEKPEGLQGNVTVEVKIPKPDGTFVRNSGSSKIKRELKDGEVDGNRKAGDTDGSHIAAATLLSDGSIRVSAKEKGHVCVVAKDEVGTEKSWDVQVLFADPESLPQASEEDYENLRKRWEESLIGKDLTQEGEEGQEILAQINADAKAAWDTYAYKGQETCAGIPWPADEGAAGNKDIPYEDDAVEFRPAMKKVLAMAKAYAAKGSDYYEDQALFKDMKEALTWLCTYCYCPKSQTDNWWTWEIGVPKDLVPALILIGDELTDEEKELYTQALYFFQPDPYHEGVIGTASTHAQGYRTAQGANLVDCTRTALGVGILREDNDLVSVAQKASSESFVIQEVTDSTQIAKNGYASGFYKDGSYLDHGKVPYLGSYGIEFLKGGTEFPPLLAGTPWEYPEEVRQNLEFYLKEGFLNGMYDGLMLDFLKGRSVSRPAGSNQAAGRDSMTIMLKLMDTVSAEAQAEMKSALKAWMQKDTGYIDTLTGVENMAAKAKAQEILEDASIEAEIPELHRNYPLMDRVIHRVKDFLFGVSMYSERIQNTEIMNGENLHGWYQGSGMTYLYNEDTDHYTTNYWNTVNPLRMPGTTVVSKNIGNGNPDSSGFLQGGDFCSPESWVGGSEIGNNGINGMAVSGKMQMRDGEGVPSADYAPNFSAKKSWFMFGDEILCLGAGITDSEDTYPVESVVENRRLLNGEDQAFTVNGEEQELPVQETAVNDILNGNADVSGEKLSDVSWAHLEGADNAGGIGYYFPGKGQEVSVRRAKNSGNWSDIGTSEGAATEEYLELWYDHGMNPQDDSYSYVLLPGRSAEETGEYAENPQITVLANDKNVQAAYGENGKVFGANVWSDEAVTVRDVTVKGQASVMTEEDENGILTVAVADPTMKNTGTIVVEIHKPIENVISKDNNVTVKKMDDGVRLTVKTKGTNGESSMVSLQLKASVSPENVTLQPGESADFTVNQYTTNADISWKVYGTETSLDPQTMIDENGHLDIAPQEKNSGLIVTAFLDDEMELTAFVSLGGDAQVEIPEEVQETRKSIWEALETANESDDLSEDAVVNAVQEAVKSISNVSNELLAEYLMGDILELENIYLGVMAQTGPVMETKVSAQEVPEIQNAEIAGAAFNVALDKKDSSEENGEDSDADIASRSDAKRVRTASDSDAVRDNEMKPIRPASASDAEKADMVEIATSSDAVKEPVRIASSSDAEVVVTMNIRKASDSDAKKAEENADKVEVTADFRLEMDTEEGKHSVLTNWTAPVKVWMDVPETMNASETILAVWRDDSGKTRKLPVEIDPDTERLSFILTGNGVVTLTQEPSQEESYQVTVEDGLKGGKLLVTPTEGTEGTTITVTAVPDEGYHLKTLLVNGKAVSVDSRLQYQFVLKEDTLVSAVFEKDNVPSGGGSSDGSSSDSDGSSSGTIIADPKVPMAGAPSYAVTGTWNQTGDSWSFTSTSGETMRSRWAYVLWNGSYDWYYFDQEGKMQTGWITLNGQTFYLQPVSDGTRGKMLTGWQQIDGTWYYFQTTSDGNKGMLLKNTVTPDGYSVDENGAWKN